MTKNDDDGYIIDKIGRRRRRVLGPRTYQGYEPKMLARDDPGLPGDDDRPRVPSNDPLLARLRATKEP